MSETNFRLRVQAAIERDGAFVVKLHGSRFGLAGLPDLHVTSRDWTGWLELKVGSEELTPRQLFIGKKIIRAGGSWFVLRETVGGCLLEDAGVDPQREWACRGLPSAEWIASVERSCRQTA